MEETPLAVLFAALSAALYFGIGFGLASLFRAPMAWRIGVGIALPVLSFLACCWIDRGATPRGIIYVSAKVLWLMPGLLLVRLFTVR